MPLPTSSPTVTDQLFSKLNDQTTLDPFWADILATPLHLRRAPNDGEPAGKLHATFTERLEYNGITTLQTSRILAPDNLIKLGNEYIDTQNFGGAQHTLHIKWGQFTNGLHFLTGAISEAGFYYVTGASEDLTVPTPTLLNFEFYAEDQLANEVKALKSAVSHLRDDFARRGVPGAETFLARFKVSHKPESSTLLHHPGLKLRLPYICGEEDAGDDDAPKERDVSRGAAALSAVTPSVWRAINGFAKISEKEYYRIISCLNLAGENVSAGGVTFYGAGLPVDEISMLMTVSKISLSKHAWVRFSTPGVGRNGSSLLLKVPARSAPNNRDLAAAQAFIVGPAKWHGLRMVYAIDQAPDLLSSKTRLRVLFEALHLANIAPETTELTKLSCFLSAANIADLQLSPASIRAYTLTRPDRKPNSP